MKLLVAGFLGLSCLVGLSGCGVFNGGGAKVGTTTLTNAPMTPDAPMPPAISAVMAQADEEDEATPPAPPIETWGVRAPTPEELSVYGF